jgi:hypothetical protein
MKNKQGGRSEFRRTADDATHRSDLGKAERALEDAITLFESQPGFVDTQLWLRDQMEEAEREAPAESKDFGTPARAELALKCFEIRAEAFVRLVSTIETQNALIAVFYQIERAAWLDFLGDYPESIRAVSEPARWLANEIWKSRGRRIRRGYEQIAARQKPLRVGSQGDHPGDRSAAKWGDIDLTFLSEERVQIRIGKELRTCNYSEFGFEDRRSGKPNRAWALLMALAKSRDGLQRSEWTEKRWPLVEKRIQEIRKVLREYFGLDDDPLPYAEGNGYRPRFRIRCGESFDS